MKTLIVYCSKTGFTRKYAQWLRDDLDCDCVPFGERHSADLSKYGAVAFGSGCYVGKINKLNWFKHQMPNLEGKKLAVFFTGAMGPDPSDIRRLEKENFTPGELCRVKTFYLQGGLNYAGMNPMDKMLMAVFRQMLRSQSGSPRHRVMLQNVEQSFDKTERENLRPLEEYLKS